MSEDAGSSPVEAPCVGSGRRDEIRLPIRPAEDVGSTISEEAGRRPVEGPCSGL